MQLWVFSQHHVIENYLPVYQKSSLFGCFSQASNEALAPAEADHVAVVFTFFCCFSSYSLHDCLCTNFMLLVEFLDHHVLESTYLMSIIRIYKVNLQYAWLLALRSSFKIQGLLLEHNINLSAQCCPNIAFQSFPETCSPCSTHFSLSVKWPFLFTWVI